MPSPSSLAGVLSSSMYWDWTLSSRTDLCGYLAYSICLVRNLYIGPCYNLHGLPGTIIGAFIVDYLGPKYTMVKIPLNLVVVGILIY